MSGRGLGGDSPSVPQCGGVMGEGGFVWDLLLPTHKGCPVLGSTQRPTGTTGIPGRSSGSTGTPLGVGYRRAGHQGQQGEWWNKGAWSKELTASSL